MQTELESKENLARLVENQMDLIEQKVAGVVSALTRLKSEKREILEERDALADKIRSLEERLSDVESGETDHKVNALKEENELLHLERESIARRIGELLDKLDLLST